MDHTKEQHKANAPCCTEPKKEKDHCCTEPYKKVRPEEFEIPRKPPTLSLRLS
jgi:hypothetical protein